MTKSHLAIMSLTLTATCFALTSCGLFQAGRPDTGAIRYSYDMTKTGVNNIVQVYDLDGKTVVQLRDIQSLTIKVLDNFNKQINYQVIGENIVLDGIQTRFTLSTQNGSARIVNTALLQKSDLAPAGTNLKDSGSADIHPESEQSLRDEIASIKDEIASLKAQLTAEKGKIAPVKELQKIVVSFGDNSTAFALNGEQEKTLLELAKKASDISIKGYTDTNVDNARSASLAEKRAKSAQAYLVQKGISQQIISVGYFAAGGFIADNKSVEGRAKNRRVEISIL